MEAAENSPPDRRRVARSPQHSRITNGSAFLPSGTDNRSAWCRRAKDVVREHLEEMGDDASVAQRALVRRIAVLTTELERLEAKFAGAGEASERDLDLYIRGSGSLRRMLEVIGINKRAPPRDTTPSLADILSEAPPESEGVVRGVTP
jgi:hypothetical protein